MWLRYVATAVLAVVVYFFYGTLFDGLLPEFAQRPTMFLILAALTFGAIAGGNSGVMNMAKSIAVYTWPIWIFLAVRVAISLSPIVAFMPEDRRDLIISVIAPAGVSVIGFLFWRFARFQELARDVGIVLSLVVHVSTIGLAISSGIFSRDVAMWAALSLAVTFGLAAVVYMPPMRKTLAILAITSVATAILISISIAFVPVKSVAQVEADREASAQESVIEEDLKLLDELKTSDSVEEGADTEWTVAETSSVDEFEEIYRRILSTKIEERNARIERSNELKGAVFGNNVFASMLGLSSRDAQVGTTSIQRYPASINVRLGLGNLETRTERPENLLGSTPDRDQLARLQRLMRGSDVIRTALHPDPLDAEVLFLISETVSDLLKRLGYSREEIRIALARAYVLTYGNKATCMPLPAVFEGFRPDSNGRIGWEFAYKPRSGLITSDAAFANDPILTSRASSSHNEGSDFLAPCQWERVPGNGSHFAPQYKERSPQVIPLDTNLTPFFAH